MIKPQNTGSQNRDYRLLYNVNLIKQIVCSFCYNKRKRKSKGLSKMYNTEKLTKQKHNTSTLDTNKHK